MNIITSMETTCRSHTRFFACKQWLSVQVRIESAFFYFQGLIHLKREFLSALPLWIHFFLDLAVITADYVNSVVFHMNRLQFSFDI
jgi:hypothetical protein